MKLVSVLFPLQGLKPGGSLVVYGYGNCQVDSDRGNKIIQSVSMRLHVKGDELKIGTSLKTQSILNIIIRKLISMQTFVCMNWISTT